MANIETNSTKLIAGDFNPQSASEFIAYVYKASNIYVRSNDYKTKMPIDKYHLINMIQNSVNDFKESFNVNIDFFSNGNMWIFFNETK